MALSFMTLSIMALWKAIICMPTHSILALSMTTHRITAFYSSVVEILVNVTIQPYE
jgi:hypothetical protein